MNELSNQLPPGHRLFYLCSMVYVTMLVVSNTAATKIAMLGPFPVAAGIVCFPVAYIFGDVLTEVYGYVQTRRVIWAGFLCLALMSFFYWAATALPPAPFFADEAAYDRLFGLVPRIVLGSLLGYLVGSFLNAMVMSKMKLYSHGKHLWMRTIASTLVGEVGDSAVFAIVAFYGLLTPSQLFDVGATGFALKVLYEVVATPLTYLIVGYLKRVEAVDTYDYNVTYRVF